jgi:hypothetical protein
MRRLSIVCLVGLVSGIAAGDPLRQGPGPDWIVSVEAEHYDANIEGPPHTWDHIMTEANGFAPPGGFSGGEAMQSQPTTPGGGAGFDTGYVGRSPHLDYEISFAKTGTYYVWVLGYGHDGNSDSLHAGLDGQGPASADRMSGINGAYNWTNSTMDPERSTIQVATKGLHTLNIWMREDGSVIDKIVLTANESYTPTGSGPPESFRGPQLKAYGPTPVDGAEAVTAPLFQWTPGETALMSKVYLGTTAELGEADAVATTPVPLYWHAVGLTAGTTYYWRVDSLEPDMVTIYEGDVWTFTVPPATAWMPGPPDGANYVDPNAVLAWAVGMNAITHDVYLSANEADVVAGAEAALLASGTADTTLPAGLLEEGATYYWRVDETTAMGEKTVGEVWSFTTLADIPVTDPHLLGWWTMDEGYGDRANDFSGHGNHGDLQGDAAWVAAGLEGAALSFDGGSDWVGIGNWNPSGTTGELTLAVWAKWAGGGGGHQGFFGKREGWPDDGATIMWFFETTNTGRLAFRTRDVSVNQDALLPAEEWAHVAATHDGTTARIYLNAEEVVSGDIALNTTSGDIGMTIGSTQVSGTESFNGLLDDARIYDQVLSPAELTTVMRVNLAQAWGPSPRSGASVDPRQLASLTWQAGDGAVQHDVYLGTDEEAVRQADASDETGIYRSQQSATSYTPVPELAWGMTYFWRVDEVAADGTVTASRVWSFTLLDFLMVDDFESYTNDSPNRVFQSWVDGLGFSGDEFFPNGNPGNGSGALVGHDVWSPTSPHYEGSITETGNVHGGAQAMPIYYNNGDMPYYSQADRTFAPTQNWTLGGVETLQVFVHGQATSLIETGPDSFIMSGAGYDIWDMSDEFTYLYKRLNGDGSLTVRVDSLENTNDWAKVGVMIRDSLDPDSKNAMAYVTPNGRVGWQYREMTSGNSSSTRSDPGAVTTPYWVRLTRTGNTIKAEHSADGVTWEPMVEVANPDEPSELRFSLDTNIYIGLAVTSHSSGVVNTTEFSNVSSTGGVTGQWQFAEIGVDHQLNDPADLYVIVQDSAGRTATVKYADGALFDEWTALDIPLADIAAAGVDLTRIAKMTVGVGDPDNPVADGSGMVLVDDITVRLPAPAPDGDGAQ